MGSMAARERTEVLEYRVTDSWLVARRCAAWQLQMGTDICVRRRLGKKRRQNIYRVHSLPLFNLSSSQHLELQQKAGAKRGDGLGAGSIFTGWEC